VATAEQNDLTKALTIADQRMYDEKLGRSLIEASTLSPKTATDDDQKNQHLAAVSVLTVANLFGAGPSVARSNRLAPILSPRPHPCYNTRI